MLGLFEKKRTLTFQISVVVTPDESGFHAYAPALKGLHVDGATAEEALDNAVKAIKVYLHSIVAHGDPLPVGPDLMVKEEEIPEVPSGAFLHNVKMQWPSLHMSGIS
jgi:predicted RNase H-like HicB family nuclease